MDSKNFFLSFGKSLYHVDSIYDNIAKNGNVSPTLLWILYALNDGKTHTQKDVCFDWSLPKSTVNTLIGELKSKNYVVLIPVKGTRREMTITLTTKGKEYADGVLKEIYEKEARVFEKLGFDSDKFIENMKKLEQALSSEKGV